MDLNGGALLRETLAFAAYFVAVVLCGLYRAILNSPQSRALAPALGCLVFASILCADVVVNNYATLNDRILISSEDWQNGYYNDGSRSAIAWSQGEGETVYRIEKDYESVSLNDALVQDYRGTRSYNSTNPGGLARISALLGYDRRTTGVAIGTETASNWISFPATSVVVDSLFDVRYVVAHDGRELSPAFYTKVFAADGYVVYESRVATGFGRLYAHCAQTDTLMSLDAARRRLALAYACTCDGVTSDWSYTDEAVGLMPMSAIGAPVSLADGQDFACPIAPEGRSVHAARANLTSSVAQYVTLAVTYQDGSSDFTQAYVLDGVESELVLDVNVAKSPTTLSIWCGDPQQVELTQLEVAAVDEELLLASLTTTAQGTVSNAVEVDGGYRLSVTNASEATCVLCLPLAYSSHWSLELDGAPAETSRVNEGFLGARIPSGEHDVVVRYTSSAPMMGVAISVVAAAAYVPIAWRWSRGLARRKADGSRRARRPRHVRA